MDYAVTVSSCFFLQNVYARFQTLNDFWKCLPADLVATSDKWTHIKIVDLMENTRLLHSELCDIEDDIILTVISNFKFTLGQKTTNQNVYESNISLRFGPNFGIRVF
eukprot:XP_016662834.1 PREDICTED: uncharacterized protein LOC107884679 [Acyrthosiphon pisum]